MCKPTNLQSPSQPSKLCLPWLLPTPAAPPLPLPPLYLFISLLQPLNTHILCAPTVLNAFDFSNPILPLGSRISHSL